MFRVKSVSYLFNKSFESSFRCYGTHLMKISDEIKHALNNGLPVVALESTIITHGMPFNKNVECALGVEKVVREAGAVPATIAIIGGKINVGLTKEQFEILGDTKTNPSIKTSRRDLAFVIANKLNGGTTVSATIIAATMAKIPIFATGGIGGVHRMGEITMDISADLTELGRNAIAVVSSGVKSILDIPKTLEYLETQGVFVCTYGKTKEFPAFYTQKSGCDAPYNVDNALEAAKILKTARDLNLNSGMLFAVPVPEEFAYDQKIIDQKIEDALKMAESFHVHGREVTPFLLAQITNSTQGKSLGTNIALVQNNAKVASEIAVNLSKINSEKESTDKVHAVNFEKGTDLSGKVVVVGGSVLDRTGKVLSDYLKLDGRIHNGFLTGGTPGGVARNICDALNKLSVPPVFITAVGYDEGGTLISNSVPNIRRLRDVRTAECWVVLDANGECIFLLGDMAAHNRITPELVREQEECVAKAALIVLDGNTPEETMETLLEMSRRHRVPVLYEPTDIPLASKPFKTKNWHSIKYITPNFKELKQISQHFNIICDESRPDEIENAALIAEKVAMYVENVLVTLGSNGLIIARRSCASSPLLLRENNNNGISVRHYPALKVDNVYNVSGAGDCFAAGLIVAMLKKLNEEECVSFALKCAIRALQSNSAVPNDFSGIYNEIGLQKAMYRSFNFDIEQAVAE